jgi:hypothetical protein
MSQLRPPEAPRTNGRLADAARAVLELFAAADADAVQTALAREDQEMLAAALQVKQTEFQRRLYALWVTAVQAGMPVPTSFGGSNPPLSADPPHLEPGVASSVMGRTWRSA